MHIHAHLILAPRLEVALLPEEFRVPSADVTHESIAQFGIDDARALTEAAARRPVAASHRTFVLWTDTMTREAQNALLKLFEEPPAGGVFFLMTPRVSALIPTLRSRLVLSNVAMSGADTDDATVFIQLPYADRLALIADLAKKKDTARMQEIADAVARMISSDPGAFSLTAVRAAVFVSAHIRTRGGSKKMLLEHLALAIGTK